MRGARPSVVGAAGDQRLTQGIGRTQRPHHRRCRQRDDGTAPPGDAAGLPRLVDSMGPEWAGLSLTMPLKRVALTVADEVSPLARAVGAANTLVFSPGGPAGGKRADNTDVAGMVAALREAGLARVERAVILGAGGTAQSALAVVRELGHESPTIVVRIFTGESQFTLMCARTLSGKYTVRYAIFSRLFTWAPPVATTNSGSTPIR